MSIADSLATKYRPKTFEQVLGQSTVVESLKGVLDSRSSHAFVLTGPSGVGKTTIARIAARYLGCDDLNTLEIDGATHSGAEHWRVLTDGLRCVPFTGDKKVVIVDECHVLSKTAWQSLLKDVEEPPPHAFYFFLTTEGSKIPATILTRCARYDLDIVRPDDIYDLLVKVCKKEGGGPPQEILAMISRNANGSPREALTALAACWKTKTTDEAALLLRTAGENPDVAVICRGLVHGDLDWERAVAILAGMEGVNAESLRLTTQGYLTKVAMGAKTPRRARKALALLEPFTTPYPAGTSLAPYLLSLGELLLGEDE